MTIRKLDFDTIYHKPSIFFCASFSAFFFSISISDPERSPTSLVLDVIEVFTLRYKKTNYNHRLIQQP